MLRIRFARTGKKKQASYRIVVAEKSRAVNSKFVEILGWYNPHTKEMELDKEKLQGWLEKGASPSDTMAKILKADGVKLPSWIKIVEKKKAPKKAEKPAAPQAKAGEKAEVVEAESSSASAPQGKEIEADIVAEEAPVEAVSEESDNEEKVVEEVLPDISEEETVAKAAEETKE